MTIKFKYWSKIFINTFLSNIPFSDNADIILLGVNKSSNDLSQGLFIIYSIKSFQSIFKQNNAPIIDPAEQQYIFSISSYFIYSTSINLLNAPAN